jgi:sorting nexin-1/2
VRRYNEFAWLRKKLVASQEGWVVPPLPEKTILGSAGGAIRLIFAFDTGGSGRFNYSFLDSRRRGLEQFLNRLARHEALSRTEELVRHSPPPPLATAIAIA